MCLPCFIEYTLEVIGYTDESNYTPKDEGGEWYAFSDGRVREKKQVDIVLDLQNVQGFPFKRRF